ncbi:glycoside hydrolase family 15 protein [Nostoc sp. CALU 546]|uniref:glycoside hydrolase family 15 protein n=1 Tax=Nostoc sp. CALU 546 TaxID=1867241 RepID=UPI003B67AE4E
MKQANFWKVFTSTAILSFGIVSGLKVVGLAFALDAPGKPGAPSVWALSAKDFIGTSASNTSRVYFTGAEGVLTEVFYPTLDTVQNVDLQFLITDASKTWGDEERKQLKHDITLINPRSLIWQVVTKDGDDRWKITKKIFTDPSRNTVIQRVTFQTLEPGKTVKDYNLYLLNNPAINNSGGGSDNQRGADNSRTLVADGRTLLIASEPNSTSSAIGISRPWKVVNGNTMVSNGFVGQNDGFTDLFGGQGDRNMDWHYTGAYGGNVAQMGWVDFGNSNASTISFDVVLAFGRNEAEAGSAANGTLNSDLATLENTYTNEWIAYTNNLKNQNGLADDQYYLAAMTLKSIQDKSNGAMIAGSGTPWGDTNGDSNRGGYHLIWARDLFKFASALMAAGDTASANRAVEYLFNVQMQTTTSENPFSRPGRFPQNSWVNGQPFWNATQMDETAMPIILAWKLNRIDLWPKIKLAAEFLAKNGPRTDQERWEEMAGYSPSTIAAEIAGLVCAADLANKAGDTGAANYYLQKADEWRNNIANWTFTTTGFHGNRKYYIRITANQDPNDDVTLEFGNGAGRHGERYIIDGGFLELVRMGVMSPNDWTILETIPEYDAILKQTIANKGDAWFRYNYDGYGEHNDGLSYNGTGRGRLWPIFTAERGIYEIVKTGNGSSGRPYLQFLKAFSSQAGFIPEQIWNNTASITDWQTITPNPYIPGTATRSMQPLSWAMGEYINLVAAMNQGRSDAPAVVCQRYSCNKPQTTVTFKVNATSNRGENVYLVGNNPLLGNGVQTSGIKLLPTANSTWTATVSLPVSTSFEYKFVKRNSSGNSIQEGTKRNFTTPANGSITRTDTL